VTLRTRWLAAFLAAVPAVLAQNVPHLAYVLPAGGRQGATFQVKTGGQFLPNVSAAYVSGSGVRATVVEYARPMNAMQAAELRDHMQALQKETMTDAVRKEMVDTRVKLLLFNARRLTSPVLAETVTLQVAIAPRAAPGKRELRVATPQGLSNPLVFCVGQLPEFTEKESISVVQPNANQPAQAQISQAPTDMCITLPATVNGRIKPGLPRPATQTRFTPGEADRYRFQAHKGHELVIAAAARTTCRLARCPTDRPPRFARCRQRHRREHAERRIAQTSPAPDTDVLTTLSKREEPRIPFGIILERGLLRPGQFLFDERQRHRAKVKADATLQVNESGDNITGSIHKVGALVQGLPACNGWTFWCYDSDGRGRLVPIDLLRQRVRAEALNS